MTEGSPHTPRSSRSNRARRLAAQLDAAPADARAAAETLQHTCNRVMDNLRDTIGTDGCAALLARSLARTEQEHPALMLVCREDGREIHLDKVADAMQRHGQAEVEAAVDALFDALFEVLGRLIGEDMAIRVINLGAAPDERRQDVS